MQEHGRRALFDATPRLGANYRDSGRLIRIRASLPQTKVGLQTPEGGRQRRSLAGFL